MAAVLSVLLGLVVVVAITAVTGYFVAQEFAYMAVDRSRLGALSASGDAAAGRALTVTKRTSFMLSGAQLGITVTALCPGPTATEFGEVAGFAPSSPSSRLAARSGPVVEAGLRGLETGRAIIIPGLMNKATAQASRFFPRAMVRRAVGMLKK